MDKDFLGNKINIGDAVVFEAPKYRHLVIGTVITKAPKSCQIQYQNTWNYVNHTEVVRQGYGQIIKHSPAPQWIPVTERLPEDGDRVVVYASGYMEFGWYDTDDSVWETDEYTYDADEVTHWMPLPQPPKEE